MIMQQLEDLDNNTLGDIDHFDIEIHIDNLAQFAIGNGDMESLAEIICIANKVNLCTPILTQAALLLSMDGESDENAINILGMVISDDYLRSNSTIISDDDWQKMKKLADELSPFVV